VTAGRPAIDWPLRLTLLFFLLFPFGPWELRAPSMLLAAAGLLVRGVRTSPLAWAVLAALAALRLILDWPLADNHAYLLAYWCLALAIACASREPPASLATSARWLVVVVFAFALLWKLALSDDYASGTFFRVLLLGDPRFERLALSVGGLTPEALDAARDVLAPGRTPLHPPEGALDTPRLRLVAHALTWAGLLLEAAVALAFAAPLPRAWQWLRHALLLVFTAATYTLAPVAGFGWLLLCMGTALWRGGPRLLVAAYAACLGLLLALEQLPNGVFGAFGPGG
jgi:hypothetical protein